ncbi:MAG: histidinol dehydrogenase [Chitinophagaceae bacterium]|jgi:histidinol dehydrogenase
MQIIQRPDIKEWSSIIARPALEKQGLDRTVAKIMEAVRRRGDKALRKYTRDFDGVSLRRSEVTLKEIRTAEKMLDEDLKSAIRQAADNIQKFHETQAHREPQVETMRGVTCWRRSLPIGKVGLYIPGGTAPLFSTILMLGIPARLAGCPEVILCSPPDASGSLHPAILFTAKLAGVHRIFKAGGVQAIAAMTYGTDTIPAVDKIFGPGNQYVTAAKRLAQSEGVAIDMPAGPSEVCVMADATADPAFVAADLLSQAEHGPDSQVLLISDDQTLIERTIVAVEEQVARLGRRDFALQALSNSKAVLVDSLETGMALVNAYAPEHLIIACDKADRWADEVTTAGSVFLGHLTPESAGDYASGTNHTLPTNGHARAYSGVSLDSFVKKVTFQRITAEGLRNVGPVVTAMARAEGLEAHARAVEVRLEALREAGK